MRVEITLGQPDNLPIAFDATLKEELEKRLFIHFSNASVRVKRGKQPHFAIMQATKADEELVNKIFQQTLNDAVHHFNLSSTFN